MGSSDGSDAVIKAAKKSLKREDSGSMKLKDLAKSVVKTLEKKSQSADLASVTKLIEDSKKFSVDGKVVSLKSSGSKRSKSESGDDANKKAKKSKKEKSSSTSDGLSQETVEAWRKEFKIVLKDTKDGDADKHKELNSSEKYFPYSNFSSPACVEGLSGALLRQCTQVNGFAKPSPIQAQCWPVLVNKQDVVGIAETGSGKTLAFSLPALSAMQQEVVTKSRKMPRMLVLAPTRELAMQSHEVLVEFGAVVQLQSLVVYGGVPKYKQTSELKKGNVDCIVATPGRLKDLIQEGNCQLGHVKYLVLDEADRMLDMGFEEDVRFIISNCLPKEKGRQTAMFSATWPAAIQNLALEYMVNPLRVYVGFEAILGSNGEDCIDDSLSANKRVTQTVEVIEDRARESRLRDLLKKFQKNPKDRVLVFALYKKEAQRLENNLRREGWDCCSIHGDKAQDARTKALGEFKDGTCPLLIATDVAARGLDIPNVEVVLNYTFPLTIEDYVHRIGRTGRAGKSGISHTFFQPGDKSHAGELQQVMKQAGQEVPQELLNFGSTIKKKEHKLYGNFGPAGGGPMKKAVKITFDNSDDES
jgi:ATP-dependent RNA helicase DBP3